jgi:hypothetical protein
MLENGASRIAAVHFEITPTMSSWYAGPSAEILTSLFEPLAARREKGTSSKRSFRERYYFFIFRDVF